MPATCSTLVPRRAVGSPLDSRLHTSISKPKSSQCTLSSKPTKTSATPLVQQCPPHNTPHPFTAASTHIPHNGNAISPQQQTRPSNHHPLPPQTLLPRRLLPLPLRIPHLHPLPSPTPSPNLHLAYLHPPRTIPPPRLRPALPPPLPRNRHPPRLPPHIPRHPPFASPSPGAVSLQRTRKCSRGQRGGTRDTA